MLFLYSKYVRPKQKTDNFAQEDRIKAVTRFTKLLIFFFLIQNRNETCNFETSYKLQWNEK